MRKIILAILLVICTNVFAQTNLNNMCGNGALPAGGGHDTFPWSIAKPFPWASIQGVWTVVNANEAQKNLVFEFKVTRSTEKSKQLFVQIYERDNCKKSYMRGVGIVNSAEKNVVRINLNNVLMKLALFKTADLEMDAETCGPKSLGVNLYRLIDNDGSEIQSRSKSPALPNEDNTNMLLRKVSNANEYRCKK